MEDNAEETNVLTTECNEKSGTNNSTENDQTSEKAKPSTTVIVRSSDEGLSTIRNRICTTCIKKIDPEYYFLWELMEFCNILCLSKFQGLNFKCIYCSRFINNTLFGKFYIRSLNIFKFFCSIPCMEYYKLTVRFCSYCHKNMSGNVSMPVSSIEVGINTVVFCSEACLTIFSGIVNKNPPKAPVKAICCVCKQDTPVTVLLKHDGMSKYFCAKRCLIAYSFVKLQTGTDQCIQCQNYYSEAVLAKFTVRYENIMFIFCSMICQSIYMLLNGKIVSCCWCQNKRYHFGMIRKFSTLSSQSLYLCSVNCFKLYECSVSKGAILQSLKLAEHNSLGISPVAPTTLGTTEVNTTLLSSLNSEHSRNEVTNNLYFSSPTLNKDIFYLKKTTSQRNVATMCFIPKADKDISVQPSITNTATQTDESKLKDVILPIPVPIYVPTPMVMHSIPIPTPVPFILPVPVPVFIPIAKQSVISIMDDIEAIHSRIPNDPCEAEILKMADIIAEERVSEIESMTLEGALNHENNEPRLNEFELNGSTMRFEKYISTDKDKKGTKRLTDNLEISDTRTSKKKMNVVKSINKISLNYALGVNAMLEWIKNNDAPKTSIKNVVKANILQMLPDELCSALNFFIKQLKKPDGTEYASDTLYYLCLGIQYYLTENGHTDNIFLDKSYDKFCKTLNKFAKKFNLKYNEESNVIVTRVEEEHLWETKQLGYHSPLVVLNTLVYFNTKHYQCSTLEQHNDISFFQILKLWRKKAKSKSMMLRFHPRKLKGTKRVFEQYTNESDETRCPVKLYEFYLSKCPESVRTSNILFYLQPEQHCTPDSPLWYTSNPLPPESLEKMINRVKMVKEINVALLMSK